MPRSRKSVLVSCCAAFTVLLIGAAAKAEAPADLDAEMRALDNQRFEQGCNEGNEGVLSHRHYGPDGD